MKSLLVFLSLSFVVLAAAQKSVPLGARKRGLQRSISPGHRDLNLFTNLIKKLKELEQKIVKLKGKGFHIDALSSNAPSDVPLMAPSDMPSLAPSDMPSLAPSDTPSLVPSDMPSLAPSDMPSIIPAKWENPINEQSLPSNFEACPSSGTSTGNVNTTELTILYGYKVKLLTDTSVLNITGQIEDLLQAALIESVCSSSSSVLAIAPSPSDIPSATCGIDLVGNGTCYLIAGRTTFLIGQDATGDTSGIYCNALDSIRTYITSGDISSKVSDVVAVNSTIFGSLIPTFCSALNIVSPGGTSSLTDGGGASSKDAGSKDGKIFGPGAAVGIGAAVGLVALALLVVNQKRRRARADVLRFNSSSGSDVEEQQTNLSPRASPDYSEGAAFSTTSFN